MPLKPEHRFRNKVRKKLDQSVDVWSIHDSYSAGVPDHWYSGWERDLWAEYKYFPTAPKKDIDLTAGKNPKLTALQQLWLNAKYDQGRNVWVIVGIENSAVVLTDKAWMKPFSASNAVPLDELITIIETFVGIEEK